MSYHCIDTRELQEELDDLENQREEIEEAIEDAKKALALIVLDDKEPHDEALKELEEAEDALQKWNDSSDADRRAELIRVKEEFTGDWSGETLISANGWVDYVEELVSEIGDMPRNIPSYIVIDWDATADNVKEDYSEIEIDGETYYYRSM